MASQCKRGKFFKSLATSKLQNDARFTQKFPQKPPNIPFFIHPTEEKASLGEISKSISRITVRCFSDLKCYNDSLTINIREHFGEALNVNLRLVQYLQYFSPIRDAKTKASHS
jgi:hypothetical protein